MSNGLVVSCVERRGPILSIAKSKALKRGLLSGLVRVVESSSL
jgi:hypothetical protein